jgi:sec-independent protein translocase protein TatB
MGGIGWAELVMIGVVALIVIGPKDLPEMFRTLGRFTSKIRSMSRDFQRAMEQAAKESGVNDVAKDLKSATSSQSLGLNAVKDAAAKFEKWDPLKNAARPSQPVAKPATPAPAAAVAEPVIAAPKPMGPATQALADQQAAKRAIAQEAAEKLRAVSAGPTEPAAVEQAPAAVSKPRAPRKKAET